MLSRLVLKRLYLGWNAWLANTVRKMHLKQMMQIAQNQPVARAVRVLRQNSPAAAASNRAATSPGQLQVVVDSPSRGEYPC